MVIAVRARNLVSIHGHGQLGNFFIYFSNPRRLIGFRCSELHAKPAPIHYSIVSFGGTAEMWGQTNDMHFHFDRTQ